MTTGAERNPNLRGVFLSDEICEWLDARAEAGGTSFSGAIRAILTQVHQGQQAELLDTDTLKMQEAARDEGFRDAQEDLGRALRTLRLPRAPDGSALDRLARATSEWMRTADRAPSKGWEDE